MPLQETPHALPLDTVHLYRWDVAQHYPRLPKQQQREQEQRFIERARNGDTTARNELIPALQHYLFSFATSFSRRGKRPDPDLWADLVQEANAQMLEVLEKAVWADNPCSYLLAVARRAMLKWVCGRNDPIKRHDKQPRIEVISLDTLLNERGLTLADLLPTSEQVEASPVAEHRYALLHEVIHTLKKKQQEVILRHYGFIGPAESLHAIGHTIAKARTRKTNIAYDRHTQALRTMRQKLEGVYV